MPLNLTKQHHTLAVFLRHRTRAPLTLDEQARYGAALEDCAQQIDGTCDREGTDACDWRCPFRELD